MLDKSIQITELYDLKHRHDSNKNMRFDYDETFIKYTTSPLMQRNPTLSNFLSQFQGLLVIMLKSPTTLRNMFNISVDKYYDKHPD